MCDGRYQVRAALNILHDLIIDRDVERCREAKITPVVLEATFDVPGRLGAGSGYHPPMQLPGSVQANN
jgi:hypothetical protein